MAYLEHTEYLELKPLTMQQENMITYFVKLENFLQVKKQKDQEAEKQQKEIKEKQPKPMFLFEEMEHNSRHSELLLCNTEA